MQSLCSDKITRILIWRNDLLLKATSQSELPHIIRKLFLICWEKPKAPHEEFQFLPHFRYMLRTKEFWAWCGDGLHTVEIPTRPFPSSLRGRFAAVFTCCKSDACSYSPVHDYDSIPGKYSWGSLKVEEGKSNAPRYSRC